MAYPEIGSTIGNYRLLKVLGEGGAALVYLGEHIYLQSLAAIKILRGYAQGQEALQIFQREARTIANLRHPHIVRLLDFGVEKELDLPYLVIDYAAHGTFYSLYAKGSLLPLTQVLFYAQQAADALQYAHDHQIIHCDVKPANMLLDANDTILLSDFGIATVMRNSMQSQEIAGTVSYMAPEQFRGKPLPASDQYALGLVVYEWLCGQLPFRGTFIELYFHHMNTIPAPLRQLRPELPQLVEEVVLRALAKEPEQRFESVQAFAEALNWAAQDAISTSSIKEFAPPTALTVFSANIAQTFSPGEEGTFISQPVQAGGLVLEASSSLNVPIPAEQSLPFLSRAASHLKSVEALKSGESAAPEERQMLPIASHSLPEDPAEPPHQELPLILPAASSLSGGLSKQALQDPEPANSSEKVQEYSLPPILRAVSGMLEAPVQDEPVQDEEQQAPLSEVWEYGLPPLLSAVSGALRVDEAQEKFLIAEDFATILAPDLVRVDPLPTVPPDIPFILSPAVSVLGQRDGSEREPYSTTQDEIAAMPTMYIVSTDLPVLAANETFILARSSELLPIEESVEGREDQSLAERKLAAAGDETQIAPPTSGRENVEQLQADAYPQDSSKAEEQEKKEQPAVKKSTDQLLTKIRVFISYSHLDSPYRVKLQTYLTSLARLYPTVSWFDGEILPGEEFDKVIQEHLREAHIILLLVSQDFIASKYCQEKELKPAMERHEKQEATVIPIIVRACHWEKHRTPFGKLQALPPGGKPIKGSKDPDTAFKHVALGIERAILNILEKQQIASLLETEQ